MALDRIRLNYVVDPHVHVRDGAMAKLVVPLSTSYCGAMLIMPNVPRLLTGRAVLQNNAAIQAIMSQHGHECDLIGCVMLDQVTSTPTTPETIRETARLGVKYAKAYFIGTTTGATGVHPAGIYDLMALEDVLHTMEEVGMTLLVHGELPGVFVLDRESRFLPKIDWLLQTFPLLRVVLEHITTADAAKLVFNGPPNLTATVTAHHAHDNLDVVIGDRCDVHAHCKPSHKFPHDVDTLQDMITRGTPKFRFGSDTAPHTEDRKVAEGCAGCFTAPHALSMLAEVFCERLSPHLVQSHLQAFVSDRSAEFYGLTRRDKPVELVREKCTVPPAYEGEDFKLIPYRAGHKYQWSMCTPV